MVQAWPGLSAKHWLLLSPIATLTALPGSFWTRTARHFWLPRAAAAVVAASWPATGVSPLESMGISGCAACVFPGVGVDFVGGVHGAGLRGVRGLRGLGCSGAVR